MPSTTTILKAASAQSFDGIALTDLANPGRPAQAASAPNGAHEEEAAQPQPVCETRLEVVRLEGVVQAIEVHCSCGEVTVVEFDDQLAAQPAGIALPNTTPSRSEAT